MTSRSDGDLSAPENLRVCRGRVHVFGCFSAEKQHHFYVQTSPPPESVIVVLCWCSSPLPLCPVCVLVCVVIVLSV